MSYYTIQLVESVLGPHMKRSGDDFDFPCPFCGEGTLHVNPSKGAAICHSCEWATRSMSFLAHKIGAKFDKPLEGYAPSNDDLAKLRRRLDEPDDRSIALPLGFRVLRPGASSLADVYYRYLNERHVTLSQIKKHNIGYCVKGRFNGYIVFPIHVSGELVYFTSRRFLASKGPKTLHPSAPVGARVFNGDGAREAKWGVIVEAPFDALTVRKKGVAVLGSAISDAQLGALKRIPVMEWTVCFDSDAWHKTLKAAWRLRMAGVDADITVLQLPYGDPNTQGPRSMKRLLAKRKTFKVTKEVERIVRGDQRERRVRKPKTQPHLRLPGSGWVS